MSRFVVSARKYRPVRFEEVVGQSHVTDTLKRAIITDKIAHAFLFCGPRGVGKTTCARILAKALNCTNPSEDREPCNTCGSCQAFNDSASFNIIELDAASNNSVDHIRQLVEQVHIQPKSGESKVFIIDEVHMLSQSAFNAFLKTLEEPPPYAVFILATTEKHKILPTILSRCQIYDFKRIETHDIVKHLTKIGKEEEVICDEEALYIIGQKADGALRDALSMFDRLSNQAEGKVTYQNVIDSLGMVDFDTYFQLTDGILAEDAADLLLVMNRHIRQGYEAEEIIKGLASHFRDLLFFKHDKLLPLVSLPAALLERYRGQSALCSESLLINGLDMMTDALYKAQLAPDKTLLFEITLSKLAYLNCLVKGQSVTPEFVEPSKKKTTNDNEVIQRISTVDSDTSLPTPKIIKASSTTIQPSIDQLSAKSPDKPQFKSKVKPTENVLLSSLAEIASEIEAEQNIDVVARLFNSEEIQSVWQDFIGTLDSDYVKRMLKSTSVNQENETIAIRVDHKRIEEAITKEFNCIMFFREAFQKPDLVVTIFIEENKSDETSEKRLITKKEKFEYLVDKNPNILEMTRRFKLKFD